MTRSKTYMVLIHDMITWETTIKAVSEDTARAHAGKLFDSDKRDSVFSWRAGMETEVTEVGQWACTSLPAPSATATVGWPMRRPRNGRHFPACRSNRTVVHPRRAPYEIYPIPPEATRALLSVETFDESIWEPACGRGAISTVLETAGYQVVSTDLIQRDYGAGEIDFLREIEPRPNTSSRTLPTGAGWATLSSATHLI